MPRRVVVVVLGIAVLTACGSSPPKAAPPRPAAQADIRQVVYTAELAVRVDDARRATERASQIAREADGYVFAQRSDLDGRDESHLTLKVPPPRFDPVLTALGELGRPLGREVAAMDVTEEAVDLDGRLKSADASADRLRALLGEAASASEVAPSRASWPAGRARSSPCWDAGACSPAASTWRPST